MGVRTGIQPLFKWTGSKQRMLEQYQRHFFPERVTRFVDLFAGGLTTTLWVAQEYPDADLVVNEFNPELALLYKTLAATPDAVIETWAACRDDWLALAPEQRKTRYYEWRETYCQDWQYKSNEYLSGLLLFMLQVNFNGMWKAYLKCNGRYSTPPGTCEQTRAFFRDGEHRIGAVAGILQRSTITCGDFGDVRIGPSDYVYADPPYRDSLVEYQGGFTEEDQARLAVLLTGHGADGGDYAYSNKDIGDGFFTRHFPGANIIPMNATYTAGRGTSVVAVKEVLITNFEPRISEVQGELFTAC